MDRPEFLSCIYRGPDGRIQETPYPRTEPDPYDVPADLYAPSYCVAKGLFGPARLKDLEVVIFNTRTYRSDPDLEEEAKGRLLSAILDKEGAAIVQAAGGADALRSQIDLGSFWAEPGTRKPGGKA